MGRSWRDPHLAALVIALFASSATGACARRERDASRGDRTASVPAALPVPARRPMERGCPACDAPVQAGAITSRHVVEASGLAASVRHPGALYVHNDSGDTPRFFALDARGGDLGTFAVRGAEAVDWEEIAVGPCPSGSCVLIADIGDNLRRRESVALYRVPEPERLDGGLYTLDAERYAFRYEDGPHNAEAIVVEPGGDVLVLTKEREGPAGIYRVSLGAPSPPPRVASRVGSLALRQGSTLITAASADPAGRSILVRTYTHVLHFEVPPGRPLVEAFASPPCPLPSAEEVQGEAVAWRHDGAGYVTVSEGANAALHRVECAFAPAPSISPGGG